MAQRPSPSSGDDEDGSALRALARAIDLQQRGRLDDAEREYASLLSRNGRDPTVLVNAGALALARGDVDASIARLSAAVFGCAGERGRPRQPRLRADPCAQVRRCACGTRPRDRPQARLRAGAQQPRHRAASPPAAHAGAAGLRARAADPSRVRRGSAEPRGDGEPGRECGARSRCLRACARPRARPCAREGRRCLRRCARGSTAGSAGRPSGDRGPASRHRRRHGRRSQRSATGPDATRTPSAPIATCCRSTRRIATRDSAWRPRCFPAEGTRKASQRSSIRAKRSRLRMPRFGALPAMDGRDARRHARAARRAGLGDVVQFARFVPRLRDRVKRIVVWLDDYWKPLAPLLATLHGIDDVIVRRRNRAATRDGARFGAVAGPYRARNARDALGRTVSRCDAGSHRDLALTGRRVGATPRRARLVGARPRRLRPGHEAQVDSRCRAGARSCDVADVAFHSLQPGADGDTAAFAGLAGSVAPTGAMISDFGDTAALIANLDLVITPDTRWRMSQAPSASRCGCSSAFTAAGAGGSRRSRPPGIRQCASSARRASTTGATSSSALAPSLPPPSAPPETPTDPDESPQRRCRSDRGSRRRQSDSRRPRRARRLRARQRAASRAARPLSCFRDRSRPALVTRATT